jgi:DNA modification methylase
MRKPGVNEVPIAGLLNHYHGDDVSDEEQAAEARRTYQPGGYRTPDEHRSIDIWQRYAEPVWDDIVQGDVLSRSQAREEADERHISPLQLTPIRRCAQLWSLSGEVIFSPFAGIGSAGFVALEMGRRFVGVELKPSYFAQAVVNLKTAERERDSRRLL